MSADLPGHPVSPEELTSLGFRPLTLEVGRLDVELPGGIGCEWRTVGDVPECAGLYAFTVSENEKLRITYVGMTEHLWMVTRGMLPRGAGARGGQRYGRPKHAGMTRKRINLLVAEQLRLGRIVRHWVCPVETSAMLTLDVRPSLFRKEDELISRWKLRAVGWNRT